MVCGGDSPLIILRMEGETFVIEGSGTQEWKAEINEKVAAGAIERLDLDCGMGPQLMRMVGSVGRRAVGMGLKLR